MFTCLRKRLFNMLLDDEGAAFVITLAVFMFMYLMILGVYAVGTNVKKRMILQNACDAAAYSAAVVEADTLSRIATLNRAMSWTYVQMTRRQMDYITDRWLEHTLEHYDHDRNTAIVWWATGTMCLAHSGWDISSTISLNGSKNVTPAAIRAARNGLNAHIASRAGSFYSAMPTRAGLESQIYDDKATIREINSAITDLAQSLPARQDTVVREILKANLPADVWAKSKTLIEMSDNPLSGEKGYLKELHNNAEDESRFLWLGGYWGNSDYVRQTHYNGGTVNPSTGDKFFRDGAGVWFKRGNKFGENESAPGIQRSYRMFAKGDGDKLYSTWTWWSSKSTCWEGSLGWHHFPGVPWTTCVHPPASPMCAADDSCHVERWEALAGRNKRIMRARVHANIFALWKDIYEGEICRPLVLNEKYFDKNGTITVGLAWQNENPWWWMGDVTKGIFSAFEPFVKWTVCFSSAKAGYKKMGENAEARNYKVDWKSGDWKTNNQSWNLCQSDWDAVMIPVRKAESSATDANWGATDAFLADYVYRLSSEAASAKAGDKWQVGTPGGEVNWNRLQERMFH